MSQGLKDILVEKGVDRNKIVVISKGANINLFRPIKGSVIDKIRERYNIRGAHVVMFVGDLSYWQGIDYLIRSAPLILEAIRNTMFFIVGDGELKEEFIHLAEEMNVADRFIFTGKIPYEKVPLYINMADVCVDLKRKLRFGYSSLI